MTDKELKRLRRSELLEMLIGQMEENEKLKIALQQAQAKADSRQIAIASAGSIAQAALALNGVFDAAQAAAAQYLENIRQMEDAARAKAQAICAEADEYSRKTRAEADNYREQTAQRLAALLRENGAPPAPARPGQGGGQP